MASAPKDFVKQIEGEAEGVKSKLKKTNTAEKTWTPTAEGTLSLPLPIRVVTLFAHTFLSLCRPQGRQAVSAFLFLSHHPCNAHIASHCGKMQIK